MLGEAGQNSRERRLARPVSSFPARIFCRGDVRKSVINEQDFVRNAARAQADLLEEMPFGFSAAHLCGVEDPVNVLGEPKNLHQVVGSHMLLVRRQGRRRVLRDKTAHAEARYRMVWIHPNRYWRRPAVRGDGIF